MYSQFKMHGQKNIKLLPVMFGLSGDKWRSNMPWCTNR